MISTSPNRFTFQKESYIKRRLEEGKSLDDPNTKAMIDFYENHKKMTEVKEKDPDWCQNNLEYDLRTSDFILEKVRSSKTYAQNLYAALCNNEFVQAKEWPILKKDYWSCSWRYAGGIIANMRREGDYIDWYCSGIRDRDDVQGYVAESDVTDEICEDLKTLGWLIVEENQNVV